MASAFAHIAVPAVIYFALKGKTVNLRLFVLSALLSILPDADVVSFTIGIPYESQWGHRGFTHSLLFSMLVSTFCALFYKSLRSTSFVVFIICFASCSSHAILDGLTNGGLGVALYWPFDNQRLFLPFRPIQVSPIGVKAFFTEKGLQVILSELLWVFLPAFLFALLGKKIRRGYKQKVTSPEVIRTTTHNK